MSTDKSLTEAVAAMEAAWRRLREVLDGPDVAAALVHRQAVRPMSTAPRDGTFVMVHRQAGPPIKLRYASGYWLPGALHFASRTYPERTFNGWSPVK
jgi:hypothetical protein